MANSVDIIIRAVEKGVAQTFSKLNTGLKSATQNLSRGQVAMVAYNKTMDRTNSAVGNLRSSVTGLFALMGGGAVFGAATRSAFGFNQTIEQSKIGIAALVRTFSDADMNESFIQATAIQKQLQLAGLKTTATYEQLLRALQEGVGPALRNGFDTRQIVSFTSSMTQAAAAISLPMDQLGQELRAIMDGTIDRNARIAKALSIENSDIKAWKEAGTLFEELDKKLRAFNDAGDQMAATFSGEWSNMKDAIQMALGLSTQKTFAATTAAIRRLRDAIVTIDEEAGTFTFSPKIVAALDKIDKRISSFIKNLTQDQLADAMVSIINVSAAVVDVLANFSGALITIFNTLGPLGPMLVKVVGYLTLFSIGWKTLSFAIITPIAGIIKFVGTLRVLTAGMLAFKFGMVGTMNALFGVAGAFVFAALQIKTQIDNYYELKKIQQEIVVLQEKNAKANSELAKKFLEISKSTGVTVTSMKELDAAVAAGKIRWDDTVGAWVTGNKKMSVAAKVATDDMKKRYQEYADLVKRLQDEIAGKQESLTEKLRSMAREGMSDLAAWKDQKAQAEEYYKAAQAAIAEGKAAVAAGNEELAKQKFEEAKQSAEKAQGAYESLSNSVEQNDKVVISLHQGLQTRMDGVRDSGQLAITAMRELEEATKNAARQLNEESGGNLAKEMPEVAKAFGELNGEVEDLIKKSADFNDAWRDAWQRAELGGKEAIAQLEKDLEELTRDRHIKIYVEEVVKKYTGGMVHRLASGGFPRLSGKLPGSDGPDGIRALLAPGEFIMRSAAVRKYGAALFHALNSMRLDVGSLIGGKVRGAIGKITLPQMEPVRMFNGGLAPFADASPGNTYNVNAYFSGNVSQVSRQNGRANARALMSELEKLHRGSSK